MLINPIDRDAVRARVLAARPYPFFCIDNFLNEDAAREAMRAFPNFDEAKKTGRKYKAVNEKNKVELTDSKTFPVPIAKVHEALASEDFLDILSYTMSMPKLLADPLLVGGGIHQTGPRGLLDVHVDFNYIKDRALFRRLNILLYFNETWRPEWGGNIELWDRKVRVCEHSFAPIFNRCVVFETNDHSFHGVNAVTCPEGIARKSMAAYYYTKEPPPGWDGKHHSTIFQARPSERLKRYVLMPAERLMNESRERVQEVKRRVRKPLEALTGGLLK